MNRFLPSSYGAKKEWSFFDLSKKLTLLKRGYEGLKARERSITKAILSLKEVLRFEIIELCIEIELLKSSRKSDISSTAPGLQDYGEVTNSISE